MNKLLARIESLKESAGADLSSAEDLSIAVMNLISLEEHFFFTAVKTEKNEYSIPPWRFARSGKRCWQS